MPSRRLLIAQAFKARYDQASVQVYGQAFSKPSGLTIERGRVRDVRAADCPLLNVVLGDEGEITEAKGSKSPPVLRPAEVATECFAVGEPAEDAVDELYLWAVRAIMADVIVEGQPMLGGLVIGLEEKKVEYNHTLDTESDKVISGCRITFRATYMTTVGDPARRS